LLLLLLSLLLLLLVVVVVGELASTVSFVLSSPLLSLFCVC